MQGSGMIPGMFTCPALQMHAGFHPEPRLSLASPLTNVSFFWDK
jgi:hypothetical protein